MLSNLVCPICKKPLNEAPGNQLGCPGCKNTWPVVDGVPCFAPGTYYYEKDLTQSNFRKFLGVAETKDWAWMVENFAPERPNLQRKAFDLSRADWRFIASLDSTSRVLDFGCGYGTMSIPLATMVSEVYAADATYEQAKFVEIRRRLLGIKNVMPICADIDTLPFLENYFDCIIMIGVLEWIPSTRKDGDPSVLQEMALRKLGFLLKEGGQIIIGIENRIGYPYFLGKRDEHIGLPFTSLMPRWLANLCSTLLKGKPYRTYTYSLNGYKRMLRKAGLRSIQAFMPIPFYHYPQAIIPLNSQSANRLQYYVFNTGFRPKRWQYMLAPRLGTSSPISRLLNLFAHSFIVVAWKGSKPSGRSFLDKALQEIGLDIESIAIMKDSFMKIRTRGGINSSAMLITFNSQPTIVVKISREPEGNDRICDEFHTLQVLHKQLPKQLSEAIPTPIYLGKHCNLSFSVQPAVGSYKLRNWLTWQRDKHAFQGSLTKYLRLAHRWLLEFQLATKSDMIEIAEKNMISLLEPVERLWHSLDIVDFDECHLLEDYKKKALAFTGSHLPLVRSHGDFTLSNILVRNEKDDRLGIVDWELSHKSTLPFEDIFTLLYSGAVLHQETNSALFISRFMTKGWYQDLLREILVEHAAALGYRLLLSDVFFPVFLAKRYHVDRDHFRFEERKNIWIDMLLAFLRHQDEIKLTSG